MSTTAALEFKCEHCTQILRAGSDRAGKKVRCPSCQKISVVPASVGAAPAAAPPVAPALAPAAATAPIAPAAPPKPKAADPFAGVSDSVTPPKPAAKGGAQVFMTGVYDAVHDSNDMMAPVRGANGRKAPAAPQFEPPTAKQPGAAAGAGGGGAAAGAASTPPAPPRLPQPESSRPGGFAPPSSKRPSSAAMPQIPASDEAIDKLFDPDAVTLDDAQAVTAPGRPLAAPRRSSSATAQAIGAQALSAQALSAQALSAQAANPPQLSVPSPTSQSAIPTVPVEQSATYPMESTSASATEPALMPVGQQPQPVAAPAAAGSGGLMLVALLFFLTGVLFLTGVILLIVFMGKGNAGM